MSIWRVMRLWSILLLAAAVACSSGAAATPAAPFPTPGPVGPAAHVYGVEQGWFDGQPVQYYNFGANTPLDPADPSRVLVDAVWVFATSVNADGSPVMLEGQGSLFTVAPGEPHYTDLWQAFFVTPSDAYAPDNVTSVEALNASGLAVEKQPMLVNCPFAPPGSTLADGAKPLQRGWVDGRPVAYFDFGPTSAQPGQMYAFVTGFEADGSPRLVPGQRFVFSASRGSPGYSDFWVVHWVTVDAGYRADSIRSAADVDQAKVTATDLVVNYPHK